MKLNEKVYIGDGLYVSWSGYDITISTPRQEGEHYIVLGPGEWANLIKFVNSLKDEPPTP